MLRPVQMSIELCLPRDAQAVPMARHIVDTAMSDLGVDDVSRHDVSVALTEACANVIDHAGPTDDFELSCELDAERCVLRVVDAGGGFDAGQVRARSDDVLRKRGRGLQLMHALVDSVEFESRAEQGTVVHLEKVLTPPATERS